MKTISRKYIVFSVITALLIWLIVELAALAGHFLIQRSFFSKSALRQQMQTALAAQPELTEIRGNLDLVWEEWHNYTEVVHPYIGFVVDPHHNQHLPISDFGFFSRDRANPILKRSPEKRIVGITGGSFALGVYLKAAEVLQEGLASGGREVVLLNFATGGYKQPQQWLILSYLLGLGAEFDMIINIDGFNEVALPAAENLPAGVYPYFPRQWDARTASRIDLEDIKRIGHIEVLKEQQAGWAGYFFRWKLYYSPAFSLVWQLRDRLLGREIFTLRQQLKSRPGQTAKSAAGYVSSGPAYEFGSEDSLYADLVALWQQCSLQMARLCRENRTAYYHFLQPNQYVAGSKPMGEAERQVALSESNPYRPAAVGGYPLLREAGAALAGMGVNYTDLTMIFRDTDESLYIDDCCHLNPRGYQLVARRICRIISGDAPPIQTAP